MSFFRIHGGHVSNICFKTLNARAADQLRKAADNVERATLPESVSWPIKFSDFSNHQIDGVIDHIAAVLPKKCRALYVFELNGGSMEAVRSAFAGARYTGDKRAYARLNHPDADCQALYVGSSRSAASRLRQHLGFGPAKTYALHIASWANGLSGSINLSVHRYDENTTDEMLLALEDQLWLELKPAFGKRGSK